MLFNKHKDPVKPVVVISLATVLFAFLLQAVVPVEFTLWPLFQSIKALSAIFCIAVLIFWHFLRNTNAALYRSGVFRLKRVAILLFIQVIVGLTYFSSLNSELWRQVSMFGLFSSGLLFISLHSDFLKKRLADAFVIFAVISIFLLLICFVSAMGGAFYSWKQVPLLTYPLSLVGAVLLLTTSLLRAQYKLNSYNLFEYIPVLIALTGLFEVFAVTGNAMWWSTISLHFCTLFSLLVVLKQLNGHSSADWTMFKNGLDLSSNAYFCSNMDGEARFVNQAYLKLLELPLDSQISHVSHPLYTHPLSDSVNKALLDHGRWRGETVLMTATGKVVSVFAEFSITQLNGNKFQQAWFYDIHEKIEFKQNEGVILEKLERLSFSLMERQEEERRYFAKELHDEIGQGLTLLKLQQQLPEPDKDLITTVLSELIDKVRNLSLNLRPAILDDMGLSSALNWLSERQRKFSQLAVTTEITPDIPRLTDKIEISVFRIAQEAFTNIHKYSFADHVLISCQMEGDYLQLILEDNGIGFDVDAKLNRANKGQSLGLLSIKERAFLVNGLVQIESTPEQGTRIELRVPMQVLDKSEDEL